MVAEKIELSEMLELYFKQQSFIREPFELYEPVNYIMDNEGKRLRPLLLMMSCQMFDGNLQKALPAAYAIELFHNFTLVHDDIMDNADLRRGKPTVHKKYGVNAAILSGDVMLSFVYQYLSEIGAEKFIELFPVWNDNLLKVFEGQQMDMNFEIRNDVSETEYLKMIEYKTSALLALALLTGAMLANTSEVNCRLIYEFGLNLGLAFQIKDDLLDAYGDTQKVGKKRGGDIEQNKKTYLLISALDVANKQQYKKLTALMNESDRQKKINEMLQLFDELNVKANAAFKIQEFYDAALNALNKIQVAGEKKRPLLMLAEQIHNRDY